MRDCYNRKIDYMRISVTNRCNFRCTYCMPETKKVEETLSLDEIYEVAFAASECGITKYKITGGEPLIREGIVDFIKKLHTLDNIKDITMTTNGFYLEKLAKDLKKAGLSSVNISLDTLEREKFKKIAGVDALNDVMAGIKEAINAGISTKINTVIQKGVNDDELFDSARVLIAQLRKGLRLVDGEDNELRTLLGFGIELLNVLIETWVIVFCYAELFE